QRVRLQRRDLPGAAVADGRVRRRPGGAAQCAARPAAAHPGVPGIPCRAGPLPAAVRGRRSACRAARPPRRIRPRRGPAAALPHLRGGAGGACRRDAVRRRDLGRRQLPGARRPADRADSRARPHVLTAALIIGIVVSLGLTELVGLTAGGIIVPGYVALLLDRPTAL